MAGIIISEVLPHFVQYPDQEKVLKPFLQGFYITRGKKRTFFRKQSETDLFEYFLSPEVLTKEQFGFNMEVLLIYSPYKEMQPRTLQAIEEIFEDHPAKGRVETLNYILISECDTVREWLNNYQSTQKDREPRIVIAFTANELKGEALSKNYIRNKISEQFFERDLFDFTLPLKEDAYYFGRERLLATYQDALKKGENRGLFGLRKTGKTSLLFKLKRIVEFEESGIFLFYDSKNPSIRKLRWNQLLGRICDDLLEITDIKLSVKHKKYDEIKISDTFTKVISRVAEREKQNKVVIVIDEIEYISFLSKRDKHWEEDFIDFWQTIWSCQSENRNLVFIVAGVNPSCVDQGAIKGVQNPLFGIVSQDYLRGFSFDEMKLMLTSLGKKMGLNFSNNSLLYLYFQYGGHPHLTRKACSWINTQVKLTSKVKPFLVEKKWLEESQESRDIDLSYYSSHVIAELSEFYPEEYTMLEFLASKQIREFLEFSNIPDLTKHLEGYGLLSYGEDKLPKISIPVVDKYIGLELAKKEGRKSIYKVIDFDDRVNWLEKRKSNIIKDFDLFDKIVSGASLPKMYGEFSFPFSHDFIRVFVCKNVSDFENFINVCYKCFVESIDKFGKSLGKNKYYNNEIATQYPSLYICFERIRVYRHERMHIELSHDPTKEKLANFLKIDLENRQPSQVADLYFVLQQCVIDSLLAGLQSEINRIS